MTQLSHDAFHSHFILYHCASHIDCCFHINLYHDFKVENFADSVCSVISYPSLLRLYSPSCMTACLI